jgi:hypothetical protein
MRLKGRLSNENIKLAKGSIDYYYLRGTPVARMWPSNPRQPQTPAQKQTRQNMKDANAWVNNQSKLWHDAWTKSRTPPRQSYRDQYLKQAILALKDCQLGVMPALKQAYIEFRPSDSFHYLILEIDNYRQVNPNDFCAYIRAQPITDPPITYYDAGFEKSICTAKKRQYQPNKAHFKPYKLDFAPWSHSFWEVKLDAIPDAVAFYFSLLTPTGQFPINSPILTPVQIAQYPDNH